MDELSETVSLSESENIPVELPEPETIASGVVKSVLGKSSASVVYEIWNPQLEVFRAVKLWRLAHSEKSLKRFEQEIKITAKLKHPNIVEIHSAGKWSGLPYMETEKVEGSDLKTMISAKGAFPEVVVSAIALCICRALIYAHNHLYTLAETTCRGVVHCDIKPANIMISHSGVVKLLDFGIAHPSNDTNSADSGSVTGSLQYMSPEQLESKPVDCRSDLYSLGVLLYEMYSGKKAFPAQTREELIQKRKEDKFEPLDCLGLNVSQRTMDVVEKLMQTDPDNRFQSAFELMEELQKIYWKATDLQPQAVISGFLGGNELELKKTRSLKRFFVPTLAASCFLLIALYLVLSSIYSKNSSKNKELQQTSFSSTVESKPLEQNQIDRIKEPVPPPVAPPPAASKSAAAPVKASRVRAKPRNKTESKPVQRASKVQKTEPAPVVETKVEEPKTETALTPESVLEKISELIKKGELTSAELMIEKNPLNDGEYHLLNAELMLRKNQLKSAKTEVMKALRVPASRISSSELRNRFLYQKATILTAYFDKSPQNESGQEAMEAWYEVKFAYRSEVSHPYYSKADTEIRRISSSMQQ
ncbi:MAG: serine/threonine protein kinase [Fibrobacter sp.]|nr:serine/threonine protein kinase [Fibrobacter sp.]